MAVIPKEIRLKIAAAVSKSVHDEKFEALKGQLAVYIRNLALVRVPQSVLEEFKRNPEYFTTENSLYVTTDAVPNFKVKGAKRTQNLSLYFTDYGVEKVLVPSGNTYFIKNMLIELSKKKGEDLTALEDEVCRLMKKFFELENKRYSFYKRLECVFSVTKFTPKTLQKEFPEAYDIYLNMDASARNVAENGNTCDNIEGLRAELLSVKSHDKKNE